MHRVISPLFFSVLFLGSITGLHDPATTPMSEYGKKLRQVAQMNRSFQLPNALVLTQAILPLGMEYFLEKTGLVKKLAGRRLNEMGIYLTVDLAYYDFYKELKDKVPSEIFEGLLIHEEIKPQLVEAIIQVSKEVTNEL